MKNSLPESLPWGHFSPSTLCQIIKFLTSIGLGRGKFTHNIYELWLKFHGETVDASVRRIHYRLNINDNITDKKILCSSRIYDRTELHFLEEACHDGVFVDAGANIGYYSLYLAKSGARTVLAIEPNPRTIERLRFNIAANDFGNIIQIESSGIGELGESSFNSSIDLGCASIVDDQETGEFIKIKTKPLLPIVREYGLQGISGMKIDIEGHEDRALVPFLQDAPKELWPKRIVLEHAHEKLWQLDLNKVLTQSGYTLLRKTRANSLLQLRSSQ
jgi:FkbM family methyltransferase